MNLNSEYLLKEYGTNNELKLLEELNLEEKEICYIEDTVFNKSFSHIIKLNLSGNRLTRLNFKLANLKVLNLNDNQIEILDSPNHS